MKKTLWMILCCLCILMASSCSSQQKDSSSPQNVVSRNDIQGKPEVKTEEKNKYIGVFKYDYEHDTETSVEDHYIVLESVNGALSGRYYGTTDDFDEAREGYLPGYFVSGIKELEIEGDLINFHIQLQNSDTFTKPIELAYKSSKEIPIDKNPKWEMNLRKLSHHYKGKIVNGEIQLDEAAGVRIFKKMDK